MRPEHLSIVRDGDAIQRQFLLALNHILVAPGVPVISHLGRHALVLVHDRVNQRGIVVS